MSKAKATPGMHWCTSAVDIARQYTRGTSDHVIVFAAHRRLLETRTFWPVAFGAPGGEENVFSFTTEHALIPLFRATMPAPPSVGGFRLW